MIAPADPRPNDDALVVVVSLTKPATPISRTEVTPSAPR